MPHKLQAQIDDWKLWSAEEFTASGVVSNAPSFVSFISVSPADATLVYECRIYDGSNTSGKRIFCIEGQFVPRHIHSYPPIPFLNGMYIDFTTNIGSVTIQHIRIGR